MPTIVREFEGYRVAIYSPGSRFAVITPPGSDRVIDLKERQPRATVVEGPLPRLERAEVLVKAFLIAEGNERGELTAPKAGQSGGPDNRRDSPNEADQASLRIS